MNAVIGWFEGDRNYPSIPQWVQWFIGTGRAYPSNDDDAQRLLMISTPCDSPAAALVSLGVVLRDLERADATDVANHALAIRSWAKGNPGGKLLRHTERRQRRAFEVTSIGGDGTLTLTEVRKEGAIGARHGTPRKNAHRAQLAGPEVMKFGPGENPDNVLLQFVPDIDDWAMPKSPPKRPPLSKKAFTWLLPDWNPLEQRLRESYSGVCFAGRKSGKARTREFLQEFGFVVQQERYGLNSMLTIDGWGEDAVSRLRYCNMRGHHAGRFDDRGTALDIIVVDGADELVKAIQSFRFRHAIAITPRDVDSGKLEALSQSLDDRFFIRVPASQRPTLEPPPPGISFEWRVRA